MYIQTLNDLHKIFDYPNNEIAMPKWWNSHAQMITLDGTAKNLTLLPKSVGPQWEIKYGFSETHAFECETVGLSKAA